MIRITNLSQLQTVLDEWCHSIQTMADDSVRGLTAEVLKEIAETGPQYSGDFVANLRVSIGQPDRTFEPYAVSPGFVNDHWEPYREGDSPAKYHAMSNALSVLPKVSLKSVSIFVSTSVQHDDDYGPLIEENRIAFRPENPSGGMTFAKAAATIQSQYRYLDAPRVARLSSMSLGGWF